MPFGARSRHSTAQISSTASNDAEIKAAVFGATVAQLHDIGPQLDASGDLRGVTEAVGRLLTDGDDAGEIMSQLRADDPTGQGMSALFRVLVGNQDPVAGS